MDKHGPGKSNYLLRCGTPWTWYLLPCQHTVQSAVGSCFPCDTGCGIGQAGQIEALTAMKVASSMKSRLSAHASRKEPWQSTLPKLYHCCATRSEVVRMNRSTRAKSTIFCETQRVRREILSSTLPNPRLARVALAKTGA